MTDQIAASSSSDSSTSVLAEILEWSTGRPSWQRDALRRLITKGALASTDIVELATVCKSDHGLADPLSIEPLEANHLPARDSELSAVTLSEITHHGGVNALAAEQRISFGPGLTIVYGDNAAGKSGYTRVLKRACRARGAEEILGNVLAGVAPGQPSATITFKVGEKDGSLAWNDQDMGKHVLGNVSVFDSHCAAVYLREKTDVAFRPFGLDLFDKLSQACESVRAILEKERDALQAPADLPKLPEGTEAQKLLSRINSLTNPDDVKRLGTLSETERTRLKHIRDQLKDLASDDPQKAARTLTLRAGRLDTLASHMRRVSESVSDGKLEDIFRARDAVEAARSATEKLRNAAFPDGLLPGTGSESWVALWNAARRFSVDEAYRGEAFPVIRDGSDCPLCQQGLKPEASDRLRRFNEFMESTLQQDFERAHRAYSASLRELETLSISDETTKATLEEIRVDLPELALALDHSFSAADSRKALAVRALKATEPLPNPLPEVSLDTPRVVTAATALRERASQVSQGANAEFKLQLTNELQELESRDILGRHATAVLGEIERKKKIAAFQLCLSDTNTRGVTQKSAEVTKAAVTTKLANSFQDELKRLRFTHVEVELREAGGERGALYHKLILKRAPDANLPRVVSEGEARTLSIASFFAELSTSSEKGAILFDDPVSSLDHCWRDNVARRLVEEAKSRQVIVFTHDIAFLVALFTCAEETHATCDHQCLRRERLASGVASPDLPWIAMRVVKRIGVLKSKWQEAEKLHRTASRDSYEQATIFIYGRLREAWERALEEILLGGIVERYRQSIQTQHVGILCDITSEDCAAVEAGMSKCSRWVHDRAGAENSPVPEPDEVKGDIEALETFVRAVNARRRK